VENLYLSVDPYMRGRMDDVESYLPPFELGQPMDGGANKYPPVPTIAKTHDRGPRSRCGQISGTRLTNYAVTGRVR
jgi:hypothetical protein